jgi:antitoxin (DNA-binding transcriptional repressor) of toxin-antitoxin stability system
MREVGASDARTHFFSLDAIERGETILITRRGRRIARITPEREGKQEEVDRAISRIREIGRRNGPISVAEIISGRDHGKDRTRLRRG